MAIKPDSILDQQKDLTPFEKQAVQELEQAIDKFLTLNYVKGQYVCYPVVEPISLAQVKAIIAIYRSAGWLLFVMPNADGRTDLPAIYFSTERETSDVLMGTPEF